MNLDKMEVQISKLAIIESVLSLNDQSILKQIEAILPQSDSDNSRFNMPKLTVEAIQEQLNSASEDIKQDNVFSTKLVWDCFKN